MTTATVARPPGAALPRRMAVAVLAAATGAAVLLWAWGASPAGPYLDHHSATATHGPLPARLGTFVLAWVLMTAATMAPTTLPLLTTFARLTTARADRSRLATAVVVGFFSVWTLAGVVAGLTDAALHELVEATALGRHPRGLAAAGLLAAAAYQLSPLATRCLRACRSPFGLVGRHWTGAPDVTRQAFAIGSDYGRSCLGCCAALMVVMLGVGMGSVAWMLGLGALMATEKLAPGGDRLARPVGVGLLVTAALVAAGVV